jgi:alpha-tubulin suppressor-like RCC1 family protein
VGQLGGATLNPVQSSPIKIPGLPFIVAIAAGLDHGMALASDGTVWTWGANVEGAIGNGKYSNTASWPPTQVPNLSGVVSISAGYRTSRAVCSDGSLWTWGENDQGELGIGSSQTVPVPTLITR